MYHEPIRARIPIGKARLGQGVFEDLGGGLIAEREQPVILGGLVGLAVALAAVYGGLEVLVAVAKPGLEELLCFGGGEGDAWIAVFGDFSGYVDAYNVRIGFQVEVLEREL